MDSLDNMVTKTVDLKSDYKQLAIHPDDRKRAVVSTRGNSGCDPVGFVLCYRLAHLLQ